MADKKLKNILSEVVKDVKNLYGEKLKEIVLYGSYSRGQNDDESDIDLLILIDIDESELKYYDKKLNNIISDIGYRHMKVLSLIDISYEKFNHWVDVVPFYKNVRNEGIIVYQQ
ncbi:MAG: DNA polymerase III subunit beta [Clostridiaceae bacterium BRH_c20a]|nr:MAG: DNA polymerase III subunit beta [Clostridiaceae bacterium BRH_c20a]